MTTKKKKMPAITLPKHQGKLSPKVYYAVECYRRWLAETQLENVVILQVRLINAGTEHRALKALLNGFSLSHQETYMPTSADYAGNRVLNPQGDEIGLAEALANASTPAEFNALRSLARIITKRKRRPVGDQPPA